MKIALLGRTKSLLDVANMMHTAGHEIKIIITSKAAPEYSAKEEDFRRFASENNIPCFSGVKIASLHNEIIQSGAQIGLSVNYPSILTEDTINLFRFGILNAHGGDLPRYKGNACQAWALLNGEKQIGLTIHKMVGGVVDSGAIVAKELYPISHSTRIKEVLDWMEERIPELFLESVKTINLEPIDYVSPGLEKKPSGLRCYPRRPEDARVDWQLDPLKIIRLINASSEPYSGAFCFLEKLHKMTIWRAELYDANEEFFAFAGTVIKIEGSNIIVACKGGAIRITSYDFIDLEEQQRHDLIKFGSRLS